MVIGGELPMDCFMSLFQNVPVRSRSRRAIISTAGTLKEVPLGCIHGCMSRIEMVSPTLISAEMGRFEIGSFKAFP
jgi:hypothetical protein